ncbi:MAG: hypothetical protein JWN18_718 [Parcubacteria group bacterium]|nr:hypothetical protein [Parcubacteria group bacterium]
MCWTQRCFASTQNREPGDLDLLSEAIRDWEYSCGGRGSSVATTTELSVTTSALTHVLGDVQPGIEILISILWSGANRKSVGHTAL